VRGICDDVNGPKGESSGDCYTRGGTCLHPTHCTDTQNCNPTTCSAIHKCTDTSTKLHTENFDHLKKLVFNDTHGLGGGRCPKLPPGFPQHAHDAHEQFPCWDVLPSTSGPKSLMSLATEIRIANGAAVASPSATLHKRCAANGACGVWRVPSGHPDAKKYPLISAASSSSSPSSKATVHGVPPHPTAKLPSPKSHYLAQAASSRAAAAAATKAGNHATALDHKHKADKFTRMADHAH